MRASGADTLGHVAKVDFADIDHIYYGSGRHGDRKDQQQGEVENATDEGAVKYHF